MIEFVQNLPDGWTIYLWMVVAAFILIAAAFMLRWAIKNEQFDEDIKYTVFSKDDEDKMEPEEFEKYKKVVAEQEKLREEHLERKRREQAAKHAGR
ncbi:MAG TPA: hypothetical protein ENJ19_06675 [Gammaproteobacteria bacterium]|nr:hypothetical protein [Gammaproteobacteria bacterium]